MKKRFRSRYTLPLADNFCKILTFAILISSVVFVILDSLVFWGLTSILIGRVLRAFLLALVFLFIIKTNISLSAYGYGIGRALFFLAGMVGLYVFFEPELVPGLFYYSRIIYWILCSVAVYRLTLRGYITEKKLLKVIYIIIVIASFFTIFYMLTPGVKAGQNINAYLLLWCYPFLFLAGVSKKTFWLSLLLTIAIVLTVKRGAMVALVVATISYVISSVRLNPHMKNVSRIFIFLTLFGLGASVVIQYNWESLLSRTEDLSDPLKAGSGRAGMYKRLYHRWQSSEITNLVLGFGSRSTERYSFQYYGAHRKIYAAYGKGLGVHAHSDLLQFLHDYGAVGISVIIALYISIISLIKKGFYFKHRYTPSLVMCFSSLFLMNIYSGFLLGPTALFFGIFIGFVSAIFKLDTVKLVRGHSSVCPDRHFFFQQP